MAGEEVAGAFGDQVAGALGDVVGAIGDKMVESCGMKLHGPHRRRWQGFQEKGLKQGLF